MFKVAISHICQIFPFVISIFYYCSNFSKLPNTPRELTRLQLASPPSNLCLLFLLLLMIISLQKQKVSESSNQEEKMYVFSSLRPQLPWLNSCHLLGSSASYDQKTSGCWQTSVYFSSASSFTLQGLYDLV